MIVRWLETHGSDPTDPSSVLDKQSLVPNRGVRAMIEDFARTAVEDEEKEEEEEEEGSHNQYRT